VEVSVDHEFEVETTEDHVNRTADRGCCVWLVHLSFSLLAPFKLQGVSVLQILRLPGDITSESEILI
jgi:hypothetical protein